MAAVQNRPQAPSPASGGRTGVIKAPRLRNSCHACASSKLKCSQDKPTCSRCAKRRLNCEYFVAKPAGRKATANLSDDERSNHVSPSTASDTTCDTRKLQANGVLLQSQTQNGAIDDRTPSKPSSVMCFSPRLSREESLAATSFGNMGHDMMGPSEQILKMIPGLPQTCVSDFFDMPLVNDTANTNMFGPDQTFTTGLEDLANLSDLDGPDTYGAFEDTIPGLFNVSSAHCGPASFSSETGRLVRNGGVQQSTTHSHPCMAKVLHLLEQLHSEDPGDDTWTVNTVQSIFALNKAAVDTIGTICSCECPCDGYRQTAMTLVLYKVLDRYAMTAQQTPSMRGSEEVGASSSARMASLAILGELHLVRRVTEQLTARLKTSSLESGKALSKTAGPPDGAQEIQQGLPDALYDQMSCNLSQRLRALSTYVVNQLRNM